jgi:hypothetical protein
MTSLGNENKRVELVFPRPRRDECLSAKGEGRGVFQNSWLSQRETIG